MRDVHLLIPTHTTRHLAPCLAAALTQDEPPRAIVLTCDTDDAAILEIARDILSRARERDPSRRLPEFLYTARPFQGEPRLNQVRNNGLRALAGGVRPADDDLIIVVDGDTMLAPDAVARHRALLERGAEMTLPYRVNLDPGRTAPVTADRVLGGEIDWESLVTGEDRARLDKRQRRMLRQRLLKCFGLTKAHRPTTLGGHHGVRWGRLMQVNGWDERFRGDGCDDDELAKRLHGLRPRPRVAIAANRIMAFHLFHETRRPHGPTEAPDYRMFASARPGARATPGFDRPREQPDPVVMRLLPVGESVPPADAPGPVVARS